MKRAFPVGDALFFVLLFPKSYCIFVVYIIKMNDLLFYSRLNNLSPELRQEVLDFIEFLNFRSENKKKPKTRKFGAAKGFFLVSDNFDAPIEDFEDYQ